MVAPKRKQPTLALIDELLAEQSRLQTPVVRASHAFDQIRNQKSKIENFQSLIPLTKPRPGEQYAFEVELDSCTGCKACVSACHSLNGLDDEETWRDVGLLVGGDRDHPFSQTVTTACHHCADPACLNGCPVLAYEKDPLTGIVRHLDDQCIGCQYCVLKCPYDVPKYSARLGIIRKCDMCHSRLAEGEAPACVQACPTSAIKIVTVLTSSPASTSTPTTTSVPSSEISHSRSAITSSFLPTAPDPSYTQPTTRYVTAKKLPRNLAPADATTLRPQPAHWPLVVMLTLLPAAVGLQLAAALTEPLVTYYVTNSAVHISKSVTCYVTLSAVLGAFGLFASVFHLGQPLRAWRIFLGWRKSWLSREALVFGPWFTLTASIPLLHWSLGLGHWTLPVAAAVTGLAGVFCSVMIYVDTRREFWRFAQTAPRFFGTAALFALAALAPRAAALALLLKLAWESRTFFHGATSSRLQRGPLARAVLTRDLLALATIVLLVAAPQFATYWVTLPLLLAGELAERYLFFRAVDSPKMPGLPAA
jgi:Fe-S-cluster-containing dehydrogenase component/DMSO reductase anchor subunit